MAGGRLIGISCFILLMFLCTLTSAFYGRTQDEDLFVLDHDDDSSAMNRLVPIRNKRDTAENEDIKTKVSKIKNSRQQLVVHWSGQGSNIMICLAKSFEPPKFKEKPAPSGVYISYDAGGSFQNKMDHFMVDNTTFASVDTFFSHKREKRFIIFVDKFNKVLYLTKNYLKDITRKKLDFSPNKILYHPDTPYIFLVHDNDKKLYITRDFGESFTLAQVMVKSFFWAEKWKDTYSDTPSRTLLVQRIESNSSAIIALKDVANERINVVPIRQEVEQFSVAGDFIFTSKRLSPGKNEVYISYQGGEFLKAEFDSNLDCAGFYVADVTERRILMVIAHTETLSNIFVSEYKSGVKKYSFRLSLERVFAYIPDVMWKTSWLNVVTEKAFADVYKVQGMKGIYIASQMQESIPESEINTAHLTSVITYDWGGEWNLLDPPVYNEHFVPYKCHVNESCSLHVAQKFNNLYPITRSLQILSSASAPGIIIAIGFIKKAEKAGIVISRDAGLTWYKVLQENYLFSMGDHGGILVAVKSFSSSGPTNEILYSLDEGETWQKHIFIQSPIKVYILMTEPGENTTVFTLFGTDPASQEWHIVTIDFRNVFKSNCTDKDLKDWYPSSKTSVKAACVLGRKETYRRRSRHSKCYMGADYDQPISTIPCACDFDDFECDVGFIRHLASPDCIRNKTDSSDPYRVPETCKPGEFYNRTKGYRKIDDDACYLTEQSRTYLPDKLPCPLSEKTQFLLVAAKDKIIRVDLVSHNHEILPVKNLRNVVAIDFDIKDNCVYFADIGDKKIGRQCLSSGKDDIEYLVTDVALPVEGIALDWLSNMLYFVNGKQAKIEVIKTDVPHVRKMRKTILNGTVLGKPRGIAIHPVAGYIFWTDWSENKPSVSRAQLDGENIKNLFVAPTVVWPNGVSIDFIGERIYWVDAKLDYIASANLDGKYMRKVVKSSIIHPYSVAVFKDDIFWDDWSLESIFSTDKDGTEATPAIRTVLDKFRGLMDLKVYDHSSQQGSNACSNKSVKCSHLCFAVQYDVASCGCPDGLVLSKGGCMCPGGNKPLFNDQCSSPVNKCSQQQFTCTINKSCIPNTWVCDGDKDCADGSDEMNCPKVCDITMVKCNTTNECIPISWKCDGENDCKDRSDETDCIKRHCRTEEFSCANNNCVSKKYVCDGDDDCKDGSDEVGCKHETPTDSICSSETSFKCNNQQCIPKTWICDGEKDCTDGSDEKNCTNNKCEDFQFRCKITNHCIITDWVCDGVSDCGGNDTSDESNCTHTDHNNPTPPIINCLNNMFVCSNGKCVPNGWKCDGINDCGDMSDELGCSASRKEIYTMPVTDKPHECSRSQFLCEDGECIQQSWVCDGRKDCRGGEDEANCESNMSCHNSTDVFHCRHTQSCIKKSLVCNGKKDCLDGTDEEDCHFNATVDRAIKCDEGYFLCDHRCLPLEQMCNSMQDCNGHSDEKNCTAARFYQVQRIALDEYGRTDTSIRVYWLLNSVSNVTLLFLPSIKLIPNDNTKPGWKNHTEWINETSFVFNDLIPSHTYNITVYVKSVANDTTYPPSIYISAGTLDSLPSPPWNFTVKQKSLYEMEASWNPPVHENGQIRFYHVFSTPPLPPAKTIVNGGQHSTKISGYFTPGTYYTFWVEAVNTVGSSNSSQVFNLVSDNDANVQIVTNLREDMSKPKNHTAVALKWDGISNSTKYRITVTTPPPYPKLPSRTTNETHFTVNDLAPGVDYQFHVNAYVKEYHGPISTITVTTPGEELPIVPGLSVTVAKHVETSVSLKWDAPKPNVYNAMWVYGIYYGLDTNELMEGPKGNTTNMSLTLVHLQACSKYMFDIGVIGPLGKGPLTATPIIVTTGHDIKAPPKNLKVTSSTHNDTLMEITWSSSCYIMAEPIRYIICIHDQILDRPSYITLFPSNDTEFSHTLIVEYGSRYKIWVQTETGMPSKAVEYWAPFLPTPHQIRAQVESDVYVIYWNLHNNLQHMPSHKFEILVSEGPTFNETTAKVYIADSSPYKCNNMKFGLIYSIAIRVLSDSGYRSPLSEITSVAVSIESTTNSSSTATKVFSIIIPITLVIVLGVAILTVFLVRHRRMQNSFSSLANSHYNTRSGAATFTTDGFGTFDDDSPVIRGFSDDEPLVVA
ncbi:sortilin-related receptor-like isoform X1 [Cimex lectularius]|uniref:Sortilin-related receptor n=1 Tax=Cimex lectularius TaxID=79782 RepID=A0A8I6TB52_CIMLE|nr:sortilin-related receptor-like isoform X1 [Cimex lectularius]